MSGGVILVCNECGNDTSFEMRSMRNTIIAECLECGELTKWGQSNGV